MQRCYKAVLCVNCSCVWQAAASSVALPCLALKHNIKH
jgi:hypothetical protein